MRVLMLSPGTRGDVVPAAALGAGLVADGHEVTVVAGREYASVVSAAGCTPAPFDASLVPGPDTPPPRGIRGHLAALRAYMDTAADAALAAAPGTDVVIANVISPYGHDIAESLGIPSFDAFLQPWHPSRAYPPMIAGVRDLGPWGNRWAGFLAAGVPTPYDPACDRVRAVLGLPPRSRRAGQRRRRRTGVPVHHGISPVVLPRPGDWPPHLSLDGFWWRPEPEWNPPARLAAFLGAGPPPIVVSLGSLPTDATVGRALTEALRATRTRAILQGGDLRDVAAEFDDSQVVHVGHLPHDRLLPETAAVVHHAGAGMASAALRAGVPSIPLPEHTDQHFWARRLHALGAATTPVPMQRVTAAALAGAVTAAVTEPRLRERASAIRDAMAHEDGTEPLRARLRRLAG
ncbi:UDP:flavonoid glycosyltransferase YjiC (YdhE family) [Stackebrandtia albiflava]|uniref:UDP:flavonoid glycosyltransferase YjiC (YdhE family) n=1 Tax=Stackebrandtia albiflava TaxID=406432 RepID=A0A562VDX7_9ACTN|nr:glycosyltransferase [Stackebrandtia albiflava]TWJ16068.1 UDP:flavonoid glycosyltransferase YjiC (YdhE family) [Stackebrandtia albiflava]